MEIGWKLPEDALIRLNAALPAGVTGRLLTIADADRLAALRGLVVSQQLPAPDCYRLDVHGPEFPLGHLGPDGPGPNGLIAGLFDGASALIGYGALTLPEPGQPNRGDALNLPADQRDQVADLESSMIREDWRRHGLHHVLIDWRLALAAALDRRHAVCSVWPGNHYSWMNLVARGIHGKALAWTRHGQVGVRQGWLRLLTHRDLAAPAPTPDPATVRLIPVERLGEQDELFAAGYWLWRGVRRSDAILAELARPRPSEA